MSIKRCAAGLKPYDIVDMPDGKRIVDRIEFTGQAIDSQGTQGVRVYWTNYPRPSLLAADKELTVLACVDTTESFWADAPPVRTYEDGSEAYGPYA